MNTNTIVSFISENSTLYPDRTIVLSKSKREKFLFEDEDEDEDEDRHPRATDEHRATIQYRTAKKIISDSFVMRVTVDAASVTELRQLVLGNCGGRDFYMKVKAIDHASKMKVWLCLNKSSIDTLISKILRSLPQAEFGKITPMQAG